MLSLIDRGVNFNDIIEALGLDMLTSPSDDRSGGDFGDQAPSRRGTGQTQESPSSDSAGDFQNSQPQSGSEGQENGGSGGNEPNRSGNDFARGGNGDDSGQDGEGLKDLEHRVSQLSADVESNESGLKAVRSEFDELQKRVDKVEENNAVLLGVYDRLTAGVNPFAEDWDTYWDRESDSIEESQYRYGVIQPPEQPPEPADETSHSEPTEASQPQETTSMDDSTDPSNDRTVSFSDLKERRSKKSRRKRRPEQQQAPGRKAYNDGRQPYLPGLASNYASDILMMEWLTLLINIAGLAGTLKALDYYENIDWISRPVKHQLEDLLSGAHDVPKVPSRAPSDLTTEEHNRSFAYIMKLAQQYQTAQS